jgi:hypothetical protein
MTSRRSPRRSHRARSRVALASAGALLSGGFAGIGAAAITSTAASAVPLSPLAPFYVESGHLTWSIDGLGTSAGSGNVQVDKPLGATVRKAFLMAAPTWGQALSGVSLAGSDITFTTHAQGPQTSSYLADVTSVVKPIIDAAPAGVSDVAIVEASSRMMDGEVLVVVFDDPNQTHDNTIALMFGASNPDGDTFAVSMAQPFHASATQHVDMSLGISFSYQGEFTNSQVSSVEVNGTRVTSSAGGQDDGDQAGSGLLTVGGIGDTTDNPADPDSAGAGTRYDDELYDLTDLLPDGATSVDVQTRNPSGDDNLFFAGLFMSDTAAIVGEGALITPPATQPSPGDPVSVGVDIRDDHGDPRVGQPFDWEVVDGPNAGRHGSGTTDGDGKAVVSYTGDGGDGTDTVRVSWTSDGSHEAQTTVTWSAVPPVTTPPTTTPPMTTPPTTEPAPPTTVPAPEKVVPVTPPPAEPVARRAPAIVGGGAPVALTQQTLADVPVNAPDGTPLAGIGLTPSGGGSWAVDTSGAVYVAGDAPYEGSMAGEHLNAPAVGIAPTPSGKGYLVVSADGGVFAFGDAQFHGSLGDQPLNGAVQAVGASCSGAGYYLAAADGGVFTFGDAQFHGSMAGTALNDEVVGIVPTCDGGGYWLVARDGGVFAFGTALFHGSLAAETPAGGVVGLVPTATGGGYWLIGADRSVTAFGDAA